MTMTNINCMISGIQDILELFGIRYRFFLLAPLWKGLKNLMDILFNTPHGIDMVINCNRIF